MSQVPTQAQRLLSDLGLFVTELESPDQKNISCILNVLFLNLIIFWC